MHIELLDILVCPDCPGNVPLRLAAGEERDGEIEEGRLDCPSCGTTYPISAGIPRFVSEAENYGENFAFEWLRWGRVQIDRHAGHRLSTERFLADSRWPAEWLAGKLLLDAGCGAGRFTDAAASLGARIIAIDLSGAVVAARHNTRDHGRNVQVIQASLFRLPLRRQSFDGVFCMGVIQHTPEPERVMSALPDYAKPGGQLAYNFYEIDWRTRFQPIKYALRRLTPHLSHKTNEWLARILTATFFPLSWLLSHVRFVRFINVMLPIAGVHDRQLSVRQQFHWTLLDTFDWYSPRYEIRQAHTRVAELLRSRGLENVESQPGLAWGVKPLRNA